MYLIGVSRRREGEGSSQESGRGEMEKVEGDERKWTTVGWERKMIGERERRGKEEGLRRRGGSLSWWSVSEKMDIKASGHVSYASPGPWMRYRRKRRVAPGKSV